MDAGSAGMNETPSAAAKKVLQPVGAVLRGVWWFGLGTAVVAGEQAGKLVSALVEKGKEAEPSVREPLKKAADGAASALEDAGAKLKVMGKKLGEGAGKMEAALDQKIAAALERTEGPLRDEVRNLAAAVDQLTRKIEQLQTKRDKPAGE